MMPKGCMPVFRPVASTQVPEEWTLTTSRSAVHSTRCPDGRHFPDG